MCGERKVIIHALAPFHLSPYFPLSSSLELSRTLSIAHGIRAPLLLAASLKQRNAALQSDLHGVRRVQIKLPPE